MYRVYAFVAGQEEIHDSPMGEHRLRQLGLTLIRKETHWLDKEYVWNIQQ